MTDLDTRVRIAQDVLFRDLDGEAVLLNPASGKYYGLNEVGTRMWTLLVEHRQVGAALQALLSEYEVSEEQLRQDLLSLVDELVEQGLLAVDAA